MPVPVEFVVEGPPLSPQARGRARWIRAVQAAALEQWEAGSPVTVDVVVAITYFYHGRAAIDVDNMAKPILDALKGFVYRDDDQVSALVSRKRNRSNDLPHSDWSDVLMERLSAPGSFVHILVDDAKDREVTV